LSYHLAVARGLNVDQPRFVMDIEFRIFRSHAFPICVLTALFSDPVAVYLISCTDLWPRALQCNRLPDGMVVSVGISNGDECGNLPSVLRFSMSVS